MSGPVPVTNDDALPTVEAWVRPNAIDAKVDHAHDRLLLILFARFSDDYTLKRRSIGDDSLLTEKQIAASAKRLLRRGHFEGSETRFQLCGMLEPLPEAHVPPPPPTKWQRTRARIIERDGACAYCGRADSLVVDHQMPKSRGGSDDDDNLVASCVYCNSSKGARTPAEWRAAQESQA